MITARSWQAARRYVLPLLVLAGALAPAGKRAALAPLGGVRIEDDVLVQTRGVRNFTREELPRGGGLV